MTLPGSLWRHPIVGRSAWTLSGQAASSGSNFLLALAILTTADTGEFAVFSLAVTAYLLVTQLTRSAFSLPVLILYSGTADEGCVPFGAAVGASVATGVIGAAAFLVAGLAYGPGRAMFLVLAAALPFLLYQDALRHVAFAVGRPKLAAQADALWIGVQVAASAVAATMGRASPTVLFSIWAAAGSLSGLLLLGGRLRIVPQLRRSWSWLGANGRLCLRLAVEFLVNSGSYYVLSYGLVVVAGAEELGRWRAAQALIGPVSVLLLGGTTIGVPESVRVRESDAKMRRFAVLLSATLSTAALLGGTAAYLLLPAVGPALFSQTWETARPVLPVLTVFAAAVGASAGAIAALRAQGQSGWIVRTRALSGAASLGLGLPLASAFGAVGALTGLTVSEAAVALVAWLRLRRTWATPTAPE